jgi:hypothetical protein
MKQLLPDAIRPPLRKVWRVLRHMKYAGDERYCPVCNHHSKLFGVVDGVVPREDAQCMYCGALERHRLVWRYLQTQTNLLASHSLKMLHVAP